MNLVSGNKIYIQMYLAFSCCRPCIVLRESVVACETEVFGVRTSVTSASRAPEHRARRVVSSAPSPWPLPSPQASAGPTSTLPSNSPYNVLLTNGRAYQSNFGASWSLSVCRYEDFTECFSLWCEEQPVASSSVFNTVAQHMESFITVRCMLFLPCCSSLRLC